MKQLQTLGTRCCLSATGLLGIALSVGSSQAQTTDSPQAQASALQEVVVTAERRESTLQKSSLSLQVLTSDTLSQAGVTDAKGLNALVPGLQVAQGGSVTQIFIRGVGDFSTNALSSGGVAVNVDGVYVARPANTSLNFYDLARVEVLKGPQGTLYGRNASGGALNLITNRPTQQFEATATLEANNYGLSDLEGALNLPISSTLAMRVASQVVARRGYLSDGTDDQRTQAGRVQLLWAPSDNLSLRVSADYAHAGGEGAGEALVHGSNVTVLAGTPVALPVNVNWNPWESQSSARSIAPIQYFNTITAVGVNYATSDAQQNNGFANLSAEMNWDLGFATLTVLPAYRNEQVNNVNFGPMFRIHNRETSDESTLEIRLAHDDRQLKWLLGAYYFNENQTWPQRAYLGPGIEDTIQRYDLGTRSYAAFGQSTWSIVDNFRLIGGLRYTKERKEFAGDATLVVPFGSRPLATGASDVVPGNVPLEAIPQSNASYNSTTWKGGFEFDLAPDHMLYATASTGFKSGGFNPGLANATGGSYVADSYRPERLTAFDGGVRNRFWDNKLQINIEGFHWLYDNHQETHFAADALGVPTFSTRNAGKATINGADIDMTLVPTSTDQIRGMVEYLRARYDSFNFDAYAPLTPQSTTGCRYTLLNPLTATLDCSGFQVARSPEWSASLSYQHTFGLPGGNALTPMLSAQYIASRWLAIDFTSNERAPSAVIADASLLFTPAQGKWSVTAFVRNMTNRAVYTGGVQNFFIPDLIAGTLGPPRTYGARFNYRY